MAIAVKESFPAEAGIDYEKTGVSIPVYFKGEFVETVEADAYLKIQRLEPFTNAYGYSQLDFLVLQWEVHGFSNALQKDVFITLSEVPQPKNIVLANQKESDYPANIVYSAIYDVYMGQERVVENQAGLGVGVDITSVPPNANIDFQKIIQFGDVTTAMAECACSVATAMDPNEWEAAVSGIINLRQGMLK